MSAAVLLLDETNSVVPASGVVSAHRRLRGRAHARGGRRVIIDVPGGPLDAHSRGRARVWRSLASQGVAYAETRMQMGRGDENSTDSRGVWRDGASRRNDYSGGGLGRRVDRGSADRFRAPISAQEQLCFAHTLKSISVDRTRIGVLGVGGRAILGDLASAAVGSYVHERVRPVAPDSMWSSVGRVVTRIPRVDASVAFPRMIITTSSADFASAIWRPSPHFDDRRRRRGHAALIIITVRGELRRLLAGSSSART